MTLKIEIVRGDRVTVVRLIGRLQREHLGVLRQQIQSCSGSITLDLAELELVSLECVRFLNDCQEQGVVMANASPYITAWMKRERTPSDSGQC